MTLGRMGRPPGPSTIKLTLFLLAQRLPWMTSVLQRQIWKTLRWTVAEGLSIQPQGGASPTTVFAISTD